MRTPEPQELMVDKDQCVLYHQYTLDKNTLSEFVKTYKSLIGISSGTVLDLGSGPCNFVVEMAKHFPKLNFFCYENSDAMIEIAKQNIKGFENQITLIKDDIRNVKGKYDVVLANRIFHHFKDPKEFWNLIEKFNTTFLVIDINRPSENFIKEIENSKDFDVLYKEDLVNSLRASWTLEEVQTQVKKFNYKIRSNKEDNDKLIVYQIK
jgi:predicted RNA methylase